MRPSSATETRRLVVTADDLGLSPAVTRAVADAARRGRLSSCSLLVNLPGWEEALAVRRAGVELGLHLNLTQGRPVAPPGEVASLVDEDGRFLPWTRLALRLARGSVRWVHLVVELEAQVSRLLEAGIVPAFINGHHHVHLWPPVHRAMLAAATGLGLEPWTRRPRVVLAPRGWGRARPAALAACARACRARGAGRRLPAPDFMLYLRGAADPVREVADLVQRGLRRCPPGASLELVCHPGCGGDGARSGAEPDREGEWRALTADEGLVTVLGGVRLVSFSELAR